MTQDDDYYTETRDRIYETNLLDKSDNEYKERRAMQVFERRDTTAALQVALSFMEALGMHHTDPYLTISKAFNQRRELERLGYLK